jgi:large subunit ribosomal protein L20
MPRVTRGNKKLLRRKKILSLAKGFFGTKKSNYRTAKEAVEKSLSYAYRDRRNRKRDFRKLWNIRINAAVREQGLNYSRFIDGLKKSNILLNRKILSNLAVNEPEIFKFIVEKAKASL